MATAFLGYVLPWGQMSLWGATVITNLFGAFPIVGKYIVNWLWGGFSVDNPTLKRFFVLHFVLPLVLIILAVSHIMLLHTYGSSNPLSINSKEDKVRFYPKFLVKDILGFLCVIGVLCVIIVYFNPNILGHPDNYIKANAMVTPPHIVPEFYFLPFYAMLRSVPNKLAGVIIMFSAILILFFLPFYGKEKGLKFRRCTRFLFWGFIFNFLFLGWVGACVVEEPYITFSQIATFFYFFYFLVVIPFFDYLEKKAKK
jgi:quinol-cytochrome oxidoreductase complex cytochrome b subunit